MVESSTARKERYSKRYVEVLGRCIAYTEVGRGAPIVFLHGNPTSSYVWRNVMPHCEGLGRLVVPDLIGMGDSEKLPSAEGPDRYRLVEHRRYLDAFLNAVGADRDVVFVMHDWGGPLGFDWANRHRDAVQGLVYMETFVRPMSWGDLPEALHPVITALRSEEGEELILKQNRFVERLLPQTILRQLAEEEMDEYRRPYRSPGEDRLPTLSWPREMPIEGEPSDVAELVDAYSEWLSRSGMPKLFINAEPGAILVGSTREFCRTWPNQTEVTVAGSHFVQEDSAEEISRAIARWYGSTTAPALSGRAQA